MRENIPSPPKKLGNHQVHFLLALARRFCYSLCHFHGAVAQLVEHHVRNVGVRGSNPLRSTIK